MGAGVICAEVVVVVLVGVVRMSEVVGLGETSSSPASGGIPGGSIAPGGRTRPGATKPGGQSGQLGRQNNEPTILSNLVQPCMVKTYIFVHNRPYTAVLDFRF